MHIHTWENPIYSAGDLSFLLKTRSYPRKPNWLVPYARPVLEKNKGEKLLHVKGPSRKSFLFFPLSMTHDSHLIGNS
jgi:hypothetical protein